MKAIILAAGVGSRIRPLTVNTPKSLLKVAGKTILGRMLENIQKVGIKEVIVVTGYLEYQVKEFINQDFPNLKVTFISNQDYQTTNTGYSLLLTKEIVDGNDFIKFDADVVFEEKVLRKLVESPYQNCLCIDHNIDLAAEEVKVQTDEEDKVIKVGKGVNPKIAAGESIGIEKISKEGAKVLFATLEDVLKDPANNQRYYDDSYTTMVEKGIPFYAIDITGLKWVEIDTPEDYKQAEELFA